ncbi:MAG TPA: OmpA family protein [Steroidobacteraceae bacterium]|nr:OmpA family protein [Steroidobacteraceae bacterium]
MNTTGNYTRYRANTLIAVAVSLVLAACAAAPLKSTGAADARAKLTVLQSDVNLANRAPVSIKEAEAAVVAAEASQTDEEEAVHLAYLADRKVEIAKAEAETQFSEDQRVKLSEQRESARLDARTHEADVAKSQVATAQAETVAVRSSAEQQTEELQRQIDELEARPTDRGLVLTLGDVLFTTGMADLKVGATNSLDKLAAFLNHYPDRSALIEGHTDSAGSDDYNMGLSQRRADSVKSYLMGQGIGSMRLAAAGKGESQPLAGNDSAAGRQQNRRVEVIIDNPPPAVVTSDLAR